MVWSISLYLEIWSSYYDQNHIFFLGHLVLVQHMYPIQATACIIINHECSSHLQSLLTHDLITNRTFSFPKFPFPNQQQSCLFQASACWFELVIFSLASLLPFPLVRQAFLLWLPCHLSSGSPHISTSLLTHLFIIFFNFIASSLTTSHLGDIFSFNRQVRTFNFILFGRPFNFLPFCRPFNFLSITLFLPMASLHSFFKHRFSLSSLIILASSLSLSQALSRLSLS